MRRAVRSEVRQSALNMRTTETLRRHLETEAAKSGRTLSHEIEYRLERSFSEDGTYTTATNAAVLRDLASIFMLVGFESKSGGNAAQRDILRAVFDKVLLAHLPDNGPSYGLLADPNKDMAASDAKNAKKSGLDYEAVKENCLKLTEAVLASSHLAAISSVVSQSQPPFGFQSNKFAAGNFISHVLGLPAKLKDLASEPEVGPKD
ncbi:hypothetical protein MKK63_24050 [Methylobacterium sp. J-088]|uniref:hypothetical protein n=1 Tax=Methylobacterium sp. J-088 TaxID=2836664 RepID=UPI001FB9D7B4|nr:hypothetical protein [Methylobacterium sp. J-088]MCJ2065752.1 hypothetical protein [Methylobacterium sp. J-088]